MSNQIKSFDQIIKKWQKKRGKAEVTDPVWYIRDILCGERYIPTKIKKLMMVIIFKMKTYTKKLSWEKETTLYECNWRNKQYEKCKTIKQLKQKCLFIPSME